MIRVLEKNVADKIAAGEVIERPVSIVKELVENSIDSGADFITVEIRHGGKSYIRVTDNGCGIPSAETETAFLRHATSKIEKAQDLDSIETLGFRGEALASITAVTHTELITKTRQERTGSRILIHGSEVIEHSATGCPDGTTIIVTDLFYNTPARFKFLKSDAAESGRIIEFVSQIALAFPEIHFRFINNGNSVFATAGNGDLFAAILSVYNIKEYRDLVPVHYNDGRNKLDGYISKPSLSRTSRKNQTYFVNGRVVNSKVIERGVNEGYRERLFEGRYPVVFLFVHTGPDRLDVNIHPNKREVRFDNEEEITSMIAFAIKDALSGKDAVIDVGNTGPGAFKFREEPSDKPAKGRASDSQMNIRDMLAAKRREVDASNETLRYFRDEQEEKAELAARVAEKKKTYGETFASQSDFSLSKPEDSGLVSFSEDKAQEAETDEIRKNDEVIHKPLQGSRLEINIKEPYTRPFNFRDLKPTGVIFGTYITCVDNDNFYLIDQHAAHERVFYEKLVGEYIASEKLRQPILTPIMIDVSNAAAAGEEQWIVPLQDMGFDIENFGGNTYVIREIPTFMSISEAEDFAKTYIEGFDEGSSRFNSVVIGKLITKSCKSAIKAHDYISMEEVKALLEQMARCKNPYSCPHGRPTFIRFSLYEIEKMFKRIE